LTTVSNSKTLGAADTFASAKLTKREVTKLMLVLEQLAYDIPDSWKTELRARRIDLGNSEGLVFEGTNLPPPVLFTAIQSAFLRSQTIPLPPKVVPPLATALPKDFRQPVSFGSGQKM